MGLSCCGCSWHGLNVPAWLLPSLLLLLVLRLLPLLLYHLLLLCLCRYCRTLLLALPLPAPFFLGCSPGLPLAAPLLFNRPPRLHHGAAVELGRCSRWRQA